jgi:hypothetical protein
MYVKQGVIASLRAVVVRCRRAAWQSRLLTYLSTYVLQIRLDRVTLFAKTMLYADAIIAFR